MSFPRVQEVVIPILREALEDVPVTSWVPDIDYRDYPLVNVRRLGGPRDWNMPRRLDKPIIELTTYADTCIEDAEELYARCVDALYDALEKQTVVDKGHLSFVRETMGMTQFSSLFQDTWRIQGLIQVGVRPRRKES